MPSGNIPPPIVDDGIVEDVANIGLESSIEEIGKVEDTSIVELEAEDGAIDVTDSTVLENMTSSDSDIVEDKSKQYILNMTDSPKVG